MVARQKVMSPSLSGAVIIILCSIYGAVNVILDSFVYCKAYSDISCAIFPKPYINRSFGTHMCRPKLIVIEFIHAASVKRFRIPNHN